MPRGDEASPAPWPAHWRAIQPARLPWRLQACADAVGTPAAGEFRTLGRGQVRLFEAKLPAAQARMTAPSHPPLRLLMPLHGRARVRIDDPQAAPQELKAGSLYLIDLRRIVQAEWTQLHAYWLVLPEDDSGERPAAGHAVLALEHGSLAHALQAQMRVLSEHGQALGRRAAEHIGAGIIDLALHACRQALQPPAPAATDTLRAALNFLRAHFHRADLRVEDVAHGIGCSRTALCRVFAAHSLTVAGELRELRLEGCRRTLASASARVNIEQIAFRNGFADLHAFSRLFKRRFGITPGQARGSLR